ncbi:MBL fold metallo-hydrolase [Oceanobacillus jeddahense]|uniref:MBL fold metallo-hydrolase n=1 Tax=Oceanobacillus jeddahense TaxID=1462527 RepID=A0ABY5JYT8_9BACI|nr:MBL fold metallo-hydrolase [Oceanobacillus jeddahense]UUI05191.1 MBL fold metallo-hydrolase [Oceanobacillus jeddahense]
MKLTVIGFWGGYPNRDGATSSYLLEKDNYKLVLDMGSGALSKLQKFISVPEIDAVILSHYHHDHVADIGVLQYAKLIDYYVHNNEKKLKIYGHTEDEEGYASLSHQYTEGVAYNPDERLKAGPFEITFLRTEHPVPCFGMRITDGDKTIVYTADSSYTEAWIPFAEDADVMITDCNYFKGQDGTAAGHMNSEEVGSIAKAANVRQLILSHLPQFGVLEQLREEAKQIYTGPIVLAEEGYVWK